MRRLPARARRRRLVAAFGGPRRRAARAGRRARSAGGPLARVSYHLDAWGATARKVLLGGRIVRLEGFRATDPDTVEAIGTDSRRVRLLVVPREAPGGAARAVLRSAADGDSTATAADILAGNGVAGTR
nr:DUF5994 family protein [Amycolatopsis rubida]